MRRTCRKIVTILLVVPGGLMFGFGLFLLSLVEHFGDYDTADRACNLIERIIPEPR